VAHAYISGEFLGSNAKERLAMCRKLAADAEQRADHAANPETKKQSGIENGVGQVGQGI
jgi:anti-sigma factor RsiW